MSLSGNLRAPGLADVLRRLAAERKTGVLRVERNPFEKRIVFQDGRIFSTWSNDPRDSFGKFLVRDGAITEDQLFDAQLRQLQEGRLIGNILLADGLLTEARLQAVLLTKAEETVYDLFLWPDGWFEFDESEFPRDVHIHIDLDVGTVLLEGARRVHEWVQIRNFFPHHLRTTFRVTGEPSDSDMHERRALGLAAASKSLAEVSVEMNWTEFETAVRFLDLHARELVALGPPAPERPETPRLSDVPALLARGYRELQDGHLEEAAQLYESILALDRLNLHAKKGLVAVNESRRRAEAEGGPPSREAGLSHVTLTVVGGPWHGAEYVVPDAPSQTILGSGADCHLRIEQPNVERYHARIAAYARGLILSDAGSVTGTYANGRPVETSHALADGDRIGLGRPGSPDSATILVRFPPHLRSAAAPAAEASRTAQPARQKDEKFR
jgi:hypothetical protein